MIKLHRWRAVGRPIKDLEWKHRMIISLMFLMLDVIVELSNVQLQVPRSVA